MGRYHSVSATSIETMLRGMGFERTVCHNEVVYTRSSLRDPNVHVKVYTSIRVGSTSVRKRGADAIRVCVVYDDGDRSFGIGKFPKVLRTTSDEAVLKRLVARLKDARERAVQWMDDQEKKGNR